MKQATNEETRPLTVHERLVSIQRELNAPKSQHNSFGNYNYRSCEDILSAVKPLLGDCTLVLTDQIVNVGDRNYVMAVASLSNGQESISASASAREAESKKGMDESQITGSASSYARKYALNGLFAIDDTKDADTRDNREEGKKTAEGLGQLLNRPSRRGIPEGMDQSDAEFIDKSVDADGFTNVDASELTGEDGSTCPIHGAIMIKKTGKYGDFWNHGRKLPDGTWQNCNGKSGWK